MADLQVHETCTNIATLYVKAVDSFVHLGVLRQSMLQLSL